MSRWVLGLVFVLACAGARAAVQPFFAPAVPAGSLDVMLHPTETVAPNVVTLVTFGVPFPRGSLTAAQLSTVRVTRNGVEIPAHVEQLTPWRHRHNAALDGASVRVALVQVQFAFPSPPAPASIAVEWGGTPRALDVPVRVDPRTAWHQVTSGTFVASDNVFEPDVYAVLPKAWLAQGALKASRSTPFVDAAPDTRDSPATNDAIAHWAGYQEAERAMKNNFFTVVNKDDPLVTGIGLCPYKTLREPWLYDRGATMFVLHFRSGGYQALREAVRATQWYADRLDADGFFTIDDANGDTKYAYNESLAYAYWLTGDVALLSRIEQVAVAQDGFPHVWTPARNFWTERHAAFKLLGKVVAYEVSGGQARRDAVEAVLAAYRDHQNGAAGQIPANRVDGGLYHFGFQHDGDWEDNTHGASSWMTALVTDAAVRAYATGEDAATAQFLVRAAAFLRSTVINTLDHSYDTFDGALDLPRYGVLFDGSDGQVNFEDVEHALDVAGQIAWGHYFTEVLGTTDTTLALAANDLYATYDEGVNHWIRPGGPAAAGVAAFRVTPWRKWGWEHRTSDGLEFALTSVPGEAPLFVDGFE